MGKTEITVMPSAYITLAASLLLLPLDWLLAAILAAGFHEVCHLAVLKHYSIPVRQITLGGMGASIRAGVMSARQELLCAAAGPLGSLSLLIWVRRFPLLALIGTAQGLFNLLPVYPLDGGRILRSILILAKNRL